MTLSNVLPVTNRRVLIVDDEPLVAMFVADVAEDAGMDVLQPVATGQAALEAAASTPPDVAIVDVSLRGSASGIEIAGELMAKHNTAIIFLTGHADIAEDPAVKALGPVAVLTKPCMPAALQEALQSALRQAPSAGTAHSLPPAHGDRRC